MLSKMDIQFTEHCNINKLKYLERLAAFVRISL
jgi:hypothetical protein